MQLPAAVVMVRPASFGFNPDTAPSFLFQREITDAVFPNNWVSFHHDGTVVLYPMFAPSRRPERRRDIIEKLQTGGFRVSRVVDLTHHEDQGRFLEGTGSVVFDHTDHTAYADISPRTNEDVLNELCGTLGY